MNTQPSSTETEDASHSPWPQRLRWALHLSWIGAALMLVAATVYIAALLRISPTADDLREAEAARPSVLLSADGEVLTTFGRTQQQHVTLAEISPYVVKALIATEDRRFYDHHGVDFKRTLSAMFHTAAGSTQGGSTLTQQLARNFFPEEIGRERSLHRKAKELVTALRIEKIYTKNQILEAYLNTAPFLYNAVGIEMASRTYWGKPAAQLTALESATLVGMLKGPRYYNPVLHPDRALRRRNLVLAQMVKMDGLSEAEYRGLVAQPMRVTLTRQTDNLGSAPHFAAYARKWLVDWAESHDQDLYADGLVIETTLDTRLQKAAEEAVQKQAESLQQVANTEWSQPSLAGVTGGLESYAQRRSKIEPFAHFWKQRPDLLAVAVRDTPEFRAAVDGGASEAQAFARLSADGEWMKRLKAQKTRLEAGFVAMDPATGDVKAWVGSRDFNVDQYDHVAQAERQPGSTFKPFVYGAALESGLRPDHGYVDEAVEIRSPDGSIWRPTDMAGASGAMLSLREGLVYSKNSITAQVMQDVGVTRVVSLAKAAGVDQSRLDPVPSLALGTSPVTLLEMVNAYATIAQEGQHHQPVVVKRIRDRHGKVIAEFGSSVRRAMSADSAVELIDMMRGVVSQGTGTMVKTRFGIVADIAGKTGTTQNNTDGWFILMHPQLVAGAWVGFNDSRVTMRSNYWGQGGHNAILLVGDFFRDSLKSGLIDPKARFATARQRPQMMASWSSEPNERDTGANMARLEVDPGAADEEPPKTAEELDRVLTNLSRRDATTAHGHGTEINVLAAPPSPPPREMPAQLLRIRSDANGAVTAD